MRALVQRVSEASVCVNGEIVGQIGRGLLVLLGVHQQDSESKADHLSKKVLQLRIFPDSEGKMNLSLLDISGEVLIVSQFTLYGDTTRGNRPSYSEAAKPELASHLYDYFVGKCRQAGVRVATGIFQAQMQVRLVNDGPVTLMCCSEEK